MTDARVQALAENYQGLESVNLVCCSEVTDAGAGPDGALPEPQVGEPVVVREHTVTVH